jgi:hypothetical protein
MTIRALDYLPPIEFEYEDFLEAMLVSDGDAFPADARGYRRMIENSFTSFGVMATHSRVVDVRRGRTLDYDRINAEELRRQADEVFRFIWDNASNLGIDTWYDTVVDDVHVAKRLSDAGFPYTESFATYTQTLDATARELESLAKTGDARFFLPAALDPSQVIRIRGAGVIVFDQFGQAKYHIAKPLLDWVRQSRRIGASVRTGSPLGPDEENNGGSGRFLGPRRQIAQR